MLTSPQVAQFQSQGFLKGGRVLADPQIEELREELERIIRDKDAAVPQPVLLHNFSREPGLCVWQIVNIWEASKAFRNLIFNRQVIEEAAQLTGAAQLRVWHDQVQYKPAGIGGVNMWHQDFPYWPILRSPSEITAWIALDDVDEDNGCMSMVPGSHLWGNQIQLLHALKQFDAMPSSFESRKIEVRRCPVGKGEVHFHHSLTWHGSHANTSGRPRRALAIHYMTQETRYAAAGNHVMKQFVKVADGRMLEGDHFPLVWERNNGK